MTFDRLQARTFSRRPVVCMIGLCALTRVVLPGLRSPALAQASPVDTLVQQAIAVMTALRSYHFSLSYTRGQTVLVRRARLHMKRARGDVERPDRLRVEVEAKLGPIGVDVSVIAIQQRVWVDFKGITDELSIEDDVAALLLDPTALLLGAVSTIEEPRLVGREEINGTAAARISGVLDPRRLPAEAAKSVFSEARPNPIDLWLDDDGRILRLRQSGPLIKSDSDDVIRQIDLSRHNEPFDIEPPD
ncbi:MAG: hypothetical protein KatS3mg059_1229 [Thermomicrobiales bacterium]|nr:MAG: hypothetical protein KatS3mg059_1229 [Thermomicrobiales bacterium]